VTNFFARLAAPTPQAGNGKTAPTTPSSGAVLPNTSAPAPTGPVDTGARNTDVPAPALFLHPGCTRAESKLGCQLSWGRDVGDYTAGEYMTAALEFRQAGDHARADRCLQQIRVLQRRKETL
jgi:hypothetical protein